MDNIIYSISCPLTRKILDTTGRIFAAGDCIVRFPTNGESLQAYQQGGTAIKISAVTFAHF